MTDLAVWASFGLTVATVGAGHFLSIKIQAARSALLIDTQNEKILQHEAEIKDLRDCLQKMNKRQTDYLSVAAFETRCREHRGNIDGKFRSGGNEFNRLREDLKDLTHKIDELSVLVGQVLAIRTGEVKQ